MPPRAMSGDVTLYRANVDSSTGWVRPLHTRAASEAAYDRARQKLLQSTPYVACVIERCGFVIVVDNMNANTCLIFTT